MYAYLALVFASLVFVPAAIAGNEDIGGGVVVWDVDCAAAAGDCGVVLDYSVGLSLGFLDGTVDLSAAMGASVPEDEFDKVERIIRRISVFDPRLAARATAMLGTFRHLVVYSLDPIQPIPDLNLEISLSHGQRLVQAAEWQRSADTGAVVNWVVNTEVWDRLDQVQRAGLILHEIFYAVHAESPNFLQSPRGLNSRYVRQFVAVISSEWLPRASQDEWDSLMVALRIF